MKLKFWSLFALGLSVHSMSVAATAATVAWAQPPVGCVEELVPEKPDRACLDLTTVEDPLKDWPASLPPSELEYWQSRKRPINYCRAMEVLRREAAQPGSQTAGRIENSWMQSIAIEHRKEKVAAVYAASRASKVPVQVLTGAVYQESLFSELGIAEDGGNFSCGVGQINLIEWCHWAVAAGEKKQAEIGWPKGLDSCSDLNPQLLSPFYEIAKTKLQGLPEYRLQKSHFAGITAEAVAGQFPPADANTQALRFAAASSFIDHCSEPTNGVLAKAHELASLYHAFVPAGLKAKDVYPSGQSFARRCQDKGFEGSYPLSSGWLLAVGMYNAGPRALDQLAHYNRWSLADVADPKTFETFQPPDLVEAFYWGGRYSAKDDLLHLKSLAGVDMTWGWMKPCVLQRHIARVIQHATLPNVTPLADSLEGDFKCAKSTFDPATGALIQSGVPLRRQRSTGLHP